MGWWGDSEEHGMTMILCFNYIGDYTFRKVPVWWDVRCWWNDEGIVMANLSHKAQMWRLLWRIILQFLIVFVHQGPPGDSVSVSLHQVVVVWTHLLFWSANAFCCRMLLHVTPVLRGYGSCLHHVEHWDWLSHSWKQDWGVSEGFMTMQRCMCIFVERSHKNKQTHTKRVKVAQDQSFWSGKEFHGKKNLVTVGLRFLNVFVRLAWQSSRALDIRLADASSSSDRAESWLRKMQDLWMDVEGVVFTHLYTFYAPACSCVLQWAQAQYALCRWQRPKQFVRLFPLRVLS